MVSKTAHSHRRKTKVERAHPPHSTPVSPSDPAGKKQIIRSLTNSSKHLAHPDVMAVDEHLRHDDVVASQTLLQLVVILVVEHDVLLLNAHTMRATGPPGTADRSPVQPKGSIVR